MKGTRFWRRLRRGQCGQAVTEQALLLALLLGALTAGGGWLMHTHPELMHAVDVHVRGFYFTLSLPFP